MTFSLDQMRSRAAALRSGDAAGVPKKAAVGSSGSSRKATASARRRTKAVGDDDGSSCPNRINSFDANLETARENGNL